MEAAAHVLGQQCARGLAHEEVADDEALLEGEANRQGRASLGVVDAVDGQPCDSPAAEPRLGEDVEQQAIAEGEPRLMQDALHLCGGEVVA